MHDRILRNSGVAVGRRRVSVCDRYSDAQRWASFLPVPLPPFSIVQQTTCIKLRQKGASLQASAAGSDDPVAALESIEPAILWASEAGPTVSHMFGRNYGISYSGH